MTTVKICSSSYVSELSYDSIHGYNIVTNMFIKKKSKKVKYIWIAIRVKNMPETCVAISLEYLFKTTRTILC